MNLSKIEEDLMLKSGCSRRIRKADMTETIERGEKDEDYYTLLDETSKLATIRAAKWIHFWSIWAIVIVVLGIVIRIITSLASIPAISEMLDK